MPGTIIDYVKEYGHIPFSEASVSDVDSLVLSQFAYMKFDGMVPGLFDNKPSVTLQDIFFHPDYENLYADVRYEEENRALFEAMLESTRFCDMRVNCYINIIEEEWETQFSAITCILGDGTLYIVYRGTDESIVGWKEDFNMAYLSPVPGQAYSVKYLNIVTGFLKKDFYVGGHSKGGNLAIYAAMNCNKKVQKRIIKVYSMDGPGFRPETLEKSDFGAISDRIVKSLPHSSLVGMIFEQNMDYLVVDSKGFGLAQHDPYTWLTENGKFVYIDDITQYQKFMDQTMNEFILGLEKEELQIFVDTMYQVISASQADNLIDFVADWKKSVGGIIEAMKEVAPETREMMKRFAKELFQLVGQRMKAEIKLLAKNNEKGNKTDE